jgi:hypothetical protein
MAFLSSQNVCLFKKMTTACVASGITVKFSGIFHLCVKFCKNLKKSVKVSTKKNTFLKIVAKIKNFHETKFSEILQKLADFRPHFCKKFKNVFLFQP